MTNSRVNWQEFWENYRKTEIRSEEDLFFEVGKTVNQRPISESAFKLSIELVACGLELRSSDRLLELCCGNGLMTAELAVLVEQVCAIDFVKRLIRHAIKYRSTPNVHYVCADAVGYVDQLVCERDFIPSKILLSDALAYFDPGELRRLLNGLKQVTENKFVFMATGIPSEELKRNFYNTPERVRRHEENQKRGNLTNEGIGRWWQKEELGQIARELELRVTVREQPPELSTFRVDAVLEPAS